MSNYIGIDIGSVSSAALLLKKDQIACYSIIPTGANSQTAAELVFDSLIKMADVSSESIEYVIATGYGRISAPFADEKITEITCHARGASWLFPDVRTIIDIGGQDSKAIEVNEKGDVVNFTMNDKCAAGSGRFLEVMVHTLQVKLEELGPLSLKSKKPARISSMCAVFAESEIVSLIAQGVKKEDIIAGLHYAVSSRIYAMANKVGVNRNVLISGGVAKNQGVVKALEDKFGHDAQVPDEPQIVVALGAALLAKEKSMKSIKV